MTDIELAHLTLSILFANFIKSLGRYQRLKIHFHDANRKRLEHQRAHIILF
jgi:hypothetical protein